MQGGRQAHAHAHIYICRCARTRRVPAPAHAYTTYDCTSNYNLEHLYCTYTCTPAAGGFGAGAQPGASRTGMGGCARTGGGEDAGCDRSGTRGDQGACGLELGLELGLEGHAHGAIVTPRPHPHRHVPPSLAPLMDIGPPQRSRRPRATVPLGRALQSIVL